MTTSRSMNSTYSVRDENPFAETPAAVEMMSRQALPDAEYEAYSDARDAALGRSFASNLPCAVYNPKGEMVGRALNGVWISAWEIEA